MSIHFRFGGSTADRTIECPSWVNLSENMPSGPAGPAALEGTMMHGLFERGMNEPDFEPAEELNMHHTVEGKVITVTGTHVEKVYTALDLQIDIEEKYGLNEVHAEVIMNTDDETGGTADIVGWSYE
jgi:hypothetical protein